MRKRTLAVSALAATGLLAVGGTAFAGAPTASATEGAQPNQSQPANTDQAGNVRTVTPDNLRQVVGVNVPVDLHDGVANNLDARNAVHDVVRVGNVVPATGVSKAVPVNAHNVATGNNTDTDNSGNGAPAASNQQGSNGKDTVKQADNGDRDGVGRHRADAVANAVATATGGVSDAVATATATADSVAPAGHWEYVNQ